MKKIAGILICIALAFSFAGCSWQIPQKVSVKTDADYNFALGNFEKDFSENLSVSKMIGDLQLPNNGKVYDYWPNKKGDTQAFLMYMPLQEIPIDIGSYFDKGTLAEKIESISFSKDIEVPKVDFEYTFDIDLNQINDAVCENFQLAGPIEDYSTSAFDGMLSEFAEAVSFEKGYLVIKAYTVSNFEDLQSVTSVTTLPRTLDVTYNGTVSITSNGKSISGSFNAGVAEINLSDYNGFELKASDININFSRKPSIYNPLDGKSYPIDFFIATIDTSNKANRPYQIEKVTNLKNDKINEQINNNPPKIHQEIDALASLKDAGLDACKIGTGQILLDFALPTEWSGVEVTYSMDLTGGIELSTGAEPLSTASNYPVSLSLNNKSISAEKIDVDASFNLLLANATIDFRKNPKIGIESNITKISTVTVKLSDTSLSFSYPEKDEDKLPSAVLDVVKSIKLNQCGITGTYTNTLPGDNNKVSLSVFSDFFKIHDSENVSSGYNFELESNSTNKAFAILGESTTVNLGTNSAEDEKDSFDFNVNVKLPGGEANKITVYDVEPGETYTFAIDLKPKIDWESVTIDTKSLPSQKDKIGTGFNPSSIFKSIDEVMGEGFSNSIKIPNCNLYLYLTKPNLSVLDGLKFNSSSISMYYGYSNDAVNAREKIGEYEKVIIANGKYTDSDNIEHQVEFAKEAPDLKVEKIDENTEVVTSKISGADASLYIPISDLLKSTDDSKVEGAQLCVDYDINLADIGGDDGIEITKAALETASESIGSIGIFAVIELPLSFTVAENTTIDLQNLINKKDSEESEDENKDLFGRSEASGFDEIEKYLEVIEAAKIQYRLDSFPIKTSNNISLNLELCDGDNQTVLAKELPFDTDATEPIEITNDDIKKLLNTYPLKLKTAEITFAGKNGTEISILRTKNLDINLQIGISTNGEPIEIFGGNK